MAINRFSILFLLYLTFTISYIQNRGFFYLPSIIALFVVFVTTVILIVKWNKLDYPNNNSLSFAYLLLVISILLSLMFYGGLYQSGLAIPVSQFILGIALLFATIQLFPKISLPSRTLFLYLGVAAIILRILMIISSPNPPIDAFYQLKEGAAGFIAGKNPYSLTFTRLYNWHESNYFTYLPSILLLTLPGTIIFADPRVSMMIIELISAYILYLYLGKNLKAGFFAFTFLYSPMSLYVLEESYADIIIASLFIFLLYLNFKNFKNLMAVILGLIISSKLALITTFPLILRSLRLSKKTIILSITIFALITLPFLLWSPLDFYKDTLVIYQETKEIFLPISLSLPAFLNRFSLPFPNILGFALLSIIFVWLFFQQKRSLALMLVSLFLWLFSLSLFSWQAFVNNYYLMGTVLLLALGVEQLDRKSN